MADAQQLQALWETGPRLLVPIAVEALVVNASDRWHGTWSVTPNQYSGLDEFEPFKPHPFSRDDSQIRQGITIRWALPDALTHATAAAGDAGLDFPFIPNRWLVLRTDTTGSQDGSVNWAPSYRAWVVDSDYLDENEGTNFYPHPFEENSLTRLGRSRLLWPSGTWQEANQPAEPHLTALGPGEPSFAAYIAHNDDVLSFYDSLEDLADLDEAATFSYLIAGWYAYPGQGVGPHLEADPLALDRWTDEKDKIPKQALWEELLERLKWSLGGDAADLDRAKNAAKAVTGAGDEQTELLLPAQILCHGLLYRINWTGTYGKTQSGVPEIDRGGDVSITDEPHIAIGNSTGDALAAMIEYLLEQSGGRAQATDIVKQIMAIESGQLELLDGLQGEIALDQALHKGWFTPESGGLHWEVVSARLDEETEPLGPADPVQKVTLTKTQRDALKKLNDCQQELNEAEVKLHNAQTRLYELWWKQERYAHLRSKPGLGADPADGAPADQLTELFEGAVDTAIEKRDEKILAERDRNKACKDLEKTLDPAKLQPLSRALPRYWRPNDPTVMIFGGRRSDLHGRDGRYRRDGDLFCRFSGQTISALHEADKDSLLDNDNIPALESLAALRSLRDDLLSNAGLPGRDLVDLIVESALLDPAYAAHIAAIIGGESSNVAADQAAIWVQPPAGTAVDEQAIAGEAGLTGLIPSRLGVSEWSRPWSPLFMSWQVTWYPTGREPKQVVGSDSWDFNPYNGLEYDWVGWGLPDHSDVLTLSGRDVLAGTDLSRLRDNLEAAATAGEDEGRGMDRDTLNRMQDQLAKADLLSQTLTGFHDQLIMRSRVEAYYPPDEPLPERVSDADGPPSDEPPPRMGQFLDADGLTTSLAPVSLRHLIGSADRLAPRAFGDGSGRTHFYPLRAGHLRLNRIWIIDAFGQVFDPIRARGQTTSSFVPLRGYGLSTVGDRRRQDLQVLQFPPRVIQPSRLDFRFVSASDDGDEGGNPVCGWLLPNHFDRSLGVYDAAGELQGTLLESAALGVSWRPAAGDETPVEEIAGLPDVHLEGILAALAARDDKDKVAVFRGLWQVIDRTLWSSDPLGDRPQSGIAHLIGRPIAIVRARLGLTLRGDPATVQLWEKTMENDSQGFGGDEAEEDVTFPVQLGDLLLRGDGTLGYFIGSDYDRFFPVYPDVASLEAGDYLAFSESFEQLQVSFGGESLFLTLLLDPRGRVHARTGILPTKALALPAAHVDEPLARMAVTFRVGPILTEPERVRLPLPAEVPGSWRWIERTGVDLGGWDEREIGPAVAAPHLDTAANTIRDGWLELSGDVEDPAGQGD